MGVHFSCARLWSTVRNTLNPLVLLGAMRMWAFTTVAADSCLGNRRMAVLLLCLQGFFLPSGSNVAGGNWQRVLFLGCVVEMVLFWYATGSFWQ